MKSSDRPGWIYGSAFIDINHHKVSVSERSEHKRYLRTKLAAFQEQGVLRRDDICCMNIKKKKLLQFLAFTGLLQRFSKSLKHSVACLRGQSCCRNTQEYYKIKVAWELLAFTRSIPRFQPFSNLMEKTHRDDGKLSLDFLK